MLRKITKRTVDGVQPGANDVFVWDTETKGFGLKVTPAGRRVYILQYQVGGRGSAIRRLTIGTHGSPWTPDKAREEAGKRLADVKLGGDPAAAKSKRRKEATIAEIADRYLREHVAPHNKPSTAAEAERIVETRIKPALGKHKVSDLTRAQVKEWHQGMHGTPYEANRSLAYMSKMMSLVSAEWELRPDNPCKGIKRFPERKRERFFSDAELKRIGEVLAAAEQANDALPGCIGAIRLLAVTGMRLGEVLSLSWEDVDLAANCVRLRDAKSGARTVPLGAPAIVVLRDLKQTGSYVVHGPNPEQPLNPNTFRHFWERVRTGAKVPDARPHDFRHTAGTYAAQAGFNAFLIRDLLGHKTLAMTGRYVERVADPVRIAADAFSGRVAAALAGETSEVVSLRKPA